MEQSIIVDALTTHASAIKGRGHEIAMRERGWFVSETQLPFISAALGRQVKAREFDGLITFLNRLYGWSQTTFGPASRTLGVLDHIRKELVEIEEKPDDLEEWIDVITLGFSGALRRGFTPWAIIKMLLFKMEKNENRQWPDWRTAEPGKAVGHIK